jgi:hypothetical protein
MVGPTRMGSAGSYCNSAGKGGSGIPVREMVFGQRFSGTLISMQP